MIAQPVSNRGMYELYAFTAHVDLITALSTHLRSSFALLLFLIFTASSRDVGDQDIHHSNTAFPFNQTACDRVGVYSLLKRQWNSIAIIKPH